MGILSFPKRNKPGKLPKQLSPVDRAIEYAKLSECDLLGVIDTDEGYVMFMAEGIVPTSHLIGDDEIPVDTISRTHAVRLRDNAAPSIVGTYENGIDAFDAWKHEVQKSEEPGFRAAMMMSEARYLLGAFPALVDARALLPMIDVAALENPYWHADSFGEARRSQLLSLALCISPEQYGKLAVHPLMQGLDLYTDGILALSQRMVTREDQPGE